MLTSFELMMLGLTISSTKQIAAANAAHKMIEEYRKFTWHKRAIVVAEVNVYFRPAITDWCVEFGGSIHDFWLLTGFDANHMEFFKAVEESESARRKALKTHHVSKCYIVKPRRCKQ